MNDNFNDSFFCRRILQKITALASGSGPMRFMEVCGTHTVRIGEAGIRSLLPKNISLVSGPGCPVCVTPGSYIDNAVEAALREGFKIATFGDMIRVPGENWSLESARASGVKVEVVTSPYDVLNITGPVMFLAVGFETTAAPIAAAVSKAVESKRDDIFFYTSLKTVPPALKALQSMPDIGIDGFLLPGHVSVIIGEEAYSGLQVPSVISGFETADILSSVYMLAELFVKNKNKVLNAYSRVVRKSGSEGAKRLLEEFFTPSSEPWRELGSIEGASLSLKDKYAFLDARKVFKMPPLKDAATENCRCGDVLKGVITPVSCPLFGNGCTPDSPVGPCMVSSEGSCSAYYRYERAGI